jgi:hypothetical protein
VVSASVVLEMVAVVSALLVLEVVAVVGSGIGIGIGIGSGIGGIRIGIGIGIGSGIGISISISIGIGSGSGIGGIGSGIGSGIGGARIGSVTRHVFAAGMTATSSTGNGVPYFSLHEQVILSMASRKVIGLVVGSSFPGEIGRLGFCRKSRFKPRDACVEAKSLTIPWKSFVCCVACLGRLFGLSFGEEQR